jgi:hypothetical protein
MSYKTYSLIYIKKLSKSKGDRTSKIEAFVTPTRYHHKELLHITL